MKYQNTKRNDYAKMVPLEMRRKNVTQFFIQKKNNRGKQNVHRKRSEHWYVCSSGLWKPSQFRASCSTFYFGAPPVPYCARLRLEGGPATERGLCNSVITCYSRLVNDIWQTSQRRMNDATLPTTRTKIILCSCTAHVIRSESEWDFGEWNIKITDSHAVSGCLRNSILKRSSVFGAFAIE